MAGAHPLDRPIWTALTTQQEHLAEINGPARRYPPDIAPFADVEDFSETSFLALYELTQPGEPVALFTPEPVSPPAQFDVAMAATGEQMVGVPADMKLEGIEIVTLGAADVAEMAELIALTNPGPFAARTHELGTFLGIRIGGRLVAITGERMRPANFVEMTSVCVHPGHRGNGYAQALLAAVGRGIVARGEQPMLHVFSSNASAIALYQRQGMGIRRRLHVTILTRAGDTQAFDKLPH
ncbi:MAG TPA: GNAT family N-acetyltransferase [Rhizomicrobium sp.]|jgi:predicted GNAT family acetyltransferase